MNRFSSKGRILYLCRAGSIAALYVVLTLLCALLGLASGPIQLRLSEALCILPFFTSAAIPGLSIGCLLANLLTGSLWQDVVFGTLATLLGASIAYSLRKISVYLVPIPTIFSNTLILPPVLAWVYHAEGGLPYLALTVGAGELLSAGGCGILLYLSLRPYASSLFGINLEKKNLRLHRKIKLPAPALRAIRLLEDCGHEAFAVGGCVRDSLLGRTPGDWDLTTNATPDEILSCFRDFRVIETGIKHGTVTVILDGMSLEITTYRTDGVYEDHRHPTEVSFSKTLEEDLSRRDFTINAMAYHPERGLVDRFGGLSDLQVGKIACVGDPKRRFEEDGLRILRAIRFASVLGFSLEKQTADAVREKKGLLDYIAKERIREEFLKLLVGKNAVPILREYADVIFTFLPELSPMKDFEHKSKFHCYDVWEHTLHAIEVSPADSLVRLALLFHDCGKPEVCTEEESGIRHFKGHAEASTVLTECALSRLRFDNQTLQTVVKLVELHDRPIVDTERSVKRFLAMMTEEEFQMLLEIKRCDRLAHAPEYSRSPKSISKIPKILKNIKKTNSCFTLASLAVNGSDLISLGFLPGKALGQTLADLLNLVIDGTLPNDKEVLLNEAKKRL